MLAEQEARASLTKVTVLYRDSLWHFCRSAGATMRVLELHNWMRIVGTTLLVAVISAPGEAQSQAQPNPDLQQLKEQLDKLDQEMQELRDKIQAAEQTPNRPGKPLPTVSASSPPQAQSQTVPLEGEVTEKKSSLDLYGFVMLDSGYEFKQQNPNWFDVMRPTQLPSFKNEFAPDGNVFAGVRQSRFGVKSSTPTSLGDLNTIFEFELFGTGVDAGQTTFRLRHAYGELGQFGAGQTWSPFMDIDVFPNSIEYWGPNGMVFFRNVQVRWMPLRSDKGRITIALERPGASADQGVYSGRIELQGVKPRFNFPDLSWQARLIRDWGYVQVAGIFRKIGWVDTNNDALNLGGSAFGWGVNVSSNLKMGKKDVAKLQVVYGPGVENYMDDAPVDIGTKNNPGNPTTPIKGVALPVLGVVSFLDHNWSNKFSSSIGYSMVNIDNSNAQNPSDFHQGHYALGNLLYHPIPKVMIGGEFQFGRRVNFSDGFNTNDYRMQFSFKYDWSKGFKF
jgi:outer membrane murein-binding lipoprotein Lpp